MIDFALEENEPRICENRFQQEQHGREAARRLLPDRKCAERI